MLRQCCYDASDTALSENNVVAPDCEGGGETLFWSDCIVFNESSFARIIAALLLTLGVNGPLLRHGLFTLAISWTVASVIAWTIVIGGSSP